MKQIAIMGEIYSTADHTVIYLGCLDTQDALKLDGWASAHFEPSHFSPEIADLILSSPWFRRVWVFQELVFSKDPKVQLGRYRLPWRLLYRVLVGQMRPQYEHLNAKGSLHSFKLLFEMHRARESHLRDEGRGSEAWGSEPTQGDAGKRSALMMIDLLRARRGLGVTHPKDMIFAHLGFASDSSDLTPRINYSIDHNVVYNAFARYMIDQGRHCELFDAISYADHSTTRNGLSSWSPNWSVTQNDLCFPRSNWCNQVCRYEGTSNEIFLSKAPLFSKKTDSLGRPVVSTKKRSLKRKNIRKDVHHTFVGYPPILACLGAKLDVVVRCSGPLSKLVELCLHDSSIGKCCWHTALNTLTHGRRSFRSTHCENESHLAGIRTIIEILKMLMEDEFTLDNFTDDHSAIIWAFLETVGVVGTTSNRHGALALLSSGKVALVPESTQPGDIVAGFLLPSSKDFTNSYLVLRPIAVKEHDLEASLTEIFCQRIRPILHCSMVGNCCVRNSPYYFSDQSTPEYRSEVTGGRASSYDTPWKRIMAGSALKESLDGSLDGSLSDFVAEFEARRRIIAWKTFAIH